MWRNGCTYVVRPPNNWCKAFEGEANINILDSFNEKFSKCEVPKNGIKATVDNIIGGVDKYVDNPMELDEIAKDDNVKSLVEDDSNYSPIEGCYVKIVDENASQKDQSD